MTKTIAQQLNIKNFPFIIKNEQGKDIYFESSDGSWRKREYNEQGKFLHYEDSDGYWCKKEYNEQGEEIYYEDSNGYIEDNRPKTVELTMDEIASKLGIDVKLLKIKK